MRCSRPQSAARRCDLPGEINPDPNPNPNPNPNPDRGHEDLPGESARLRVDRISRELRGHEGGDARLARARARARMRVRVRVSVR